MLNICLCDDEVNILTYYSKKITKLLEENNYIFKINLFKSGENLIFELEENPNRFNIIIIDIIMKNINGIETAKILRKYGYVGIIIFLTSSKIYALDAFSVEPLSYILKGDCDYKFNDIILKAASNIYMISNRRLVISCKPQNKVINLDTIVYMESFNKKIIIHKISGDSEEVNSTFKCIYDKVKNYNFIRCHKSYIVNSKYVKSFNKTECTLQKNIVIPIGRKYSKDFRNKFFKNDSNNIII